MSDGVIGTRSTVVLYGRGVALASDLAGQVHAGQQHGLFAGDTRVLSTYQFEINGRAWTLLGHRREGQGSARWDFQNALVRDAVGELPAGHLFFRLHRRLDGALHDDFYLRSYLQRPVDLAFTLQLDAGFEDIFSVKSGAIPGRLQMLRRPIARGLLFDYDWQGFRRGLRVTLSASGGPAPVLISSRMIFQLHLPPGGSWHCCLDAEPVIDGEILRQLADPHRPPPPVLPADDRLRLDAAPILKAPFDRGRMDLQGLSVPQPPEAPYLAAGAPWFLALFGRDSLLAAIMAGIGGSGPAAGALAALARLQGEKRDDFRDEEPGKIAHEYRRDELTGQGLLPYSPYYGTAEAPMLYCLALWHLWRWSGRQDWLRRFLPAAQKCLEWCTAYGDRDQDGFQEYGTRSPVGYRNQGWKDAGDAVVDAQGRQPPLPLGTVELQGYWYAALQAMAELLEAVGAVEAAQQHREQAAALRRRVEARYWMPAQAFYAFALDGAKQWVDGLASNAGQLLWCGLPQPQRAAQVTRRLLAPDFFSGWGLRTLSADNPAYNPLSYQLGSVWPHDTALAAAGMWRYGHRAAGSRLLHAMLKAATAFEEQRLPELFCGLDAADGPPVPYDGANSPQAWAAAAPLLAAQLFLGLLPDAPHGRCYLSPYLPDWLPELTVEGITIGGERLDVALRREGAKTVIKALHSGALEVVQDLPLAPLWGQVPA
jgi:hypothetical protein